MKQKQAENKIKVKEKKKINQSMSTRIFETIHKT